MKINSIIHYVSENKDGGIHFYTRYSGAGKIYWFKGSLSGHMIQGHILGDVLQNDLWIEDNRELEEKFQASQNKESEPVVKVEMNEEGKEWIAEISNVRPKLLVRPIQCDNCERTLDSIVEIRNGLCSKCFGEFYRGVEPEDQEEKDRISNNWSSGQGFI